MAKMTKLNTTSISARISTDTWKKIRIQSILQSKTLGALLEEVVTDYLKKKGIK